MTNSNIAIHFRRERKFMRQMRRKKKMEVIRLRFSDYMKTLFWCGMVYGFLFMIG